MTCYPIFLLNYQINHTEPPLSRRLLIICLFLYHS
nr:MAG TPA: hypothetical protein [Caudoviricetes sp.]